MAADDFSAPLEDFALDPERFRALGYRFVDLMAGVLAREAEDPVLPPVSGAELRALLDEPLPAEGAAPGEILATLGERILPHGRRNGHPRFFGYVCASADPLGALADGLASLWNQNVTAWRSAPAATELERLVLRWLDELVGFGGGGQGLLVSGGSAANHTALASALAGRPRDRVAVYRSTEGHLSLAKACRVLGVPEDQVRTVGTDARRRLVPGELERRIRADRDAGLEPACACASAGTANTGAIDPLEEIAEVCAEHGLWLHVDGAYGAPAAATEEYGWMRAGFARADSLSLDPHKWLYAPLDAGCVLLRDGEAARRAFALASEYTAVEQTEPIESFAFFDHGLELSRRARALKVWILLKARGARRLARAIAANVALRRHLDARVEADGRLEPLGSELSISCFRYAPPELPEERRDTLNRGILAELVRSGRFLLSPTTLDGTYALRVCIVNFRTTREDVDLLVDEVLRLGDRALSG